MQEFSWSGKGILEVSAALGNRDNAGFQVPPCLTPWVEVCNVGQELAEYPCDNNKKPLRSCIKI